tara:strand:- start:189 stop:476 length:288 start_codon:yes stop_codon:yes gene_type:complete
MSKETLKLALEALEISQQRRVAFQKLATCTAPKASAERARLELFAEEASSNEKLLHDEAIAAIDKALTQLQRTQVERTKETDDKLWAMMFPNRRL